MKKTRRPSPNLPLISHAPPPILQQLPKLHHKRSLSYGSTRDMGLKSGPQVEQCSACSRISLGVEGRDGSVRRPLTPVRQVEEGLEVLPDLQGDVDLHGDNEKRRHIYLHSVGSDISVKLEILNNSIVASLYSFFHSLILYIPP